MITLVGHVKEKDFPEDFPKEVNILRFVDCPTTASLKKAIYDFSAETIQSGGISTSLDLAALQDPERLDPNGIWIPMSSIAYLSYKVRNLTGELSRGDEEGNQSLVSGNEIKIQ